jgi:hypothetical protein
MPLYEVAILEVPTVKEIEELGKSERLVFGPQAVVAKDQQSAAVAAVMAAGTITVEESRMQVLIRPFK